MLDWTRHSDETEMDAIVARHAAIGINGSKDSASHERQFRDLLQALPAAIYTTDATGRITFFNRACIDFARRTPKIGKMWCVAWKLYLPAAVAQAIAVAVHELATNAAKYGSLSAPSGRLDVRWGVDEAGVLVLRWIENGGPKVNEPTRKGFGVGAIDGVIRTQKGRISRRWRPEGLDCELLFPEIGVERSG